MYYPHTQLSVDEAMIPFKGRSSMKQYLPMKPVKRGFKVWAMADALNGYLYDFNVYTGAAFVRSLFMVDTDCLSTLRKETASKLTPIYYRIAGNFRWC